MKKLKYLGLAGILLIIAGTQNNCENKQDYPRHKTTQEMVQKIKQDYAKGENYRGVQEMVQKIKQDYAKGGNYRGVQEMVQKIKQDYAKGENYQRFLEGLRKESDKTLLARMIYGECRQSNCSKEERIGIAYTAINRIYDGKKWDGETLRQVILCPQQYSSFNQDDPNREKLMNPNRKIFATDLKIAQEVLSRRYRDPTDGATYYHTINTCPNWSKSPSMIRIGKIGNSNHIFYKER